MPDSIIQRPLAIVGMDCRLPDADSVDAFWDLLLEGRSAVRPLTDRVLDRSKYFDSRKGIHGMTYTEVGGLIPARPLDRSLLGLTDEAMADWDECHLIFAEVAARAWRSVCAAGNKSKTSRVGVYIGHSGGSRMAGDLVYSTLAEQTADLLWDSPSFSQLRSPVQRAVIDGLIERMRRGRPKRRKGGKPYLDASAAARLVAEVLHLTGPRIVLDAACASSLVALGLAALEVQSGAIDAAIVGGASYNKVDSLILFSQAQSCSATASRPFDEAADGLISSEGYIVFVIKTLDRAMADGDTIHGVLTGLGIATDGRGKSLWAPRREGQALAMRRAYASAEAAKRVQYVEAHATSTQVGDATETQALADFFGAHHRKGSLPVGSVKSNIGHTLETAGLAGLLKTILAMKHATIPPTIHLDHPSSSIDWSAAPFYVPTHRVAWPLPPAGGPRCGAVNAFGIGGLNVHVVVEQFSAIDHLPQSLAPCRDENADRSKVAWSEPHADDPIAIVGFGTILPGAQSPSQLADLLKSRESKVVEPPRSRWRQWDKATDELSTARGGFLLDYAYDWKKHRVPPKQVDRANPLQFMLLDAAGQALGADAAGSSALEDRTSVVVGTVFGGEFGHQLQLGLRLSELRADLLAAMQEQGLSPSRSQSLAEEFSQAVLRANPALLDETGSFTSSTLASRITKQFNLRGGAMAIDAGEGSGDAALITACELLKSHVSDRVLCAAGTRALDLPSYQTLDSKGELIDANGRTRFPGEGVVVLLLKRRSEALQAGDKVLGLIHGISRKEGLADATSRDAQFLPRFEIDRLSSQIGELKSAQSILAIAAFLSSDAVDERTFYRIDERRADEQYEIILSKGADLPKREIPKRVTSVVTGHRGAVPEPIAGKERSDELISSIAQPSRPLPKGWTDLERPKPLVAFVFPGQGSQRAEKLGELARQSNAVKAAIELADATLGELGCEPFHQLAHRAIATPLNRQSIWPIQASVLIADLAYAAWLHEKELRPDLVIGHSLGELAALVVAGVWSLPEAIRFVRARAEAVAQQTTDDSGLLSIQRSFDEVEAMLRRFPAPLFVTHDNGPAQSVVGGQLIHLRELQKHLTEKRWPNLLLDVPAAFHTPMMSSAQLILVDTARATSLRMAACPLLSTVSGRLTVDPEECRRNLIAQLTAPVRYRACVEQAYAMGARHFIEVGSGTILTRLNQSILKEHRTTCLAVDGQDDFAAELKDAIESKRSAMHKDETNARNGSSVAGSSERQLAAVTSNASATRIVSLDATSNRRAKRREQAREREVFQAESSGPGISLGGSPIDKPIEKGIRQVDEVEAFVRDFIVEHTGYPQEMIELDWDLEADLGIDSIKQAQLFGELRELFALEVNRLTTREVKTLRQIVGVLNGAGGKREWLERPAVPAETVVKPVEDLPGLNRVETAPVAAGNPSADRATIADFMIDFVVDQTGYPREIIDLHADFEADLGLDSIKLAQLFGELRSNFSLPVSPNDRSVLARCRTLDDILRLFPSNNFEKPSMSTPDSSPSRAVYAQGVAWGIENAAKIHERIIASMDRWRFSEPGAGRNEPVNRLGPRAFDDSMLVSDREWWRGVTEGAGFDDDFGIAELDSLTRLIDATANESASSLADELPSVGEEESETGITHRYRMKMVSAPLAEGAAVHPIWKGSAIVLGENPVAVELADSLSKHGVDCHLFHSAKPLDSMLAEMRELWKQQPVLHLYLTSPCDAQAALSLSSAEWRSRRTSAMIQLFHFCQEWLKLVADSGRIQDASLLAVTRLGGDFGFEGKVIAPESGLLTGLLKAIVIENWVNGHRGLSVKIVDTAASDSSEATVRAIHAELANTSYDMEISWAGGVRRVVRAEKQPAARSNQGRVTRRGNWICTGGGRGITAYVAEQLALRYDLTLHLLGTAPVPRIPDDWRDLDEERRRRLKLQVMQQAREEKSSAVNPIKAWENAEKAIEIDATLRRFEKLGIRAYYYCCDCSDPVQVEQTLSKVRQQFGAIRGCLHGAGVGQDARFDRKRPEKVAQCLSAKIDGSMALMEATQRDPLEFFIGFGSISGRFGANGHTDYSMANDGMAKWIDWYRALRPEVRAVCFHWHAWGDVGMATKPETKLALEMIDMQFMPAQEGVNHLLREIDAGAPDREVLITDDRYYRMFYPAETLDESGNARKSASSVGLLESHDECTLDPKTDVFLREHRLKDRPLLPMVVGLEVMVEAVSRKMELIPMQFGGPKLRVDGFESLRGLRFFQDAPQTIELSTLRSSSLGTEVELTSSFYSRNGMLLERQRRYMRATVGQATEHRLFDWVKPEPPRAGWQEAVYPKPGSDFYVGPAFRVLKEYFLQQSRIVGRIQAPSLIELAGTRRNIAGWRTPSAVIDACLFATGILAWHRVRPGICLPVSIEKLLMHRMPTPGESCFVESRLMRSDERSAWFDFSVWGSDGTLRLEAKGYRASWLESEWSSE